MFCEKCGSLMKVKNGKFSCSCGHTQKGSVITEKIDHKDIEIIEDIERKDTIPIVCWNCKKRGVYFWMRQMARADEAPTRFYKCKHCGKVWRSSN